MNFIHHIRIENFKSIRECQLDNLKRINLFIGRPNVGKSNILEALSLFSLPFIKENSSKKLTSLIRLENEPELFYNGNFETSGRIVTDIGAAEIQFNPKIGLTIDLDTYGGRVRYSIDDKLTVKSTEPSFKESVVKKYVFNPLTSYRKSHSRYLIPPNGFNLLNILDNYEPLREQVKSLFAEYGLEIAFDKASQTLKIIQSNRDNLFLIPYNSIADTLQRIIFYLAAIHSNNNSILLFEEPEAHSFPPYMTHITQEMIFRKDNQFFVATHSPVVLNDLLENGRDELAVYIVHYHQHQTRLTRLTEERLHEIFQFGVDIFTNSETFI